MKTETQKKIWEALLYFLLLIACLLLIVNYILFKSESGRCVINTKEFLIEHFEKLTGGNITCTCLTDVPIDRTSSSSGGGNKIIFSSFGYDETSFTVEFLENVSINKSI